MTPKEAAIEVERVLKNSGYILGDLSFSEMVGRREASYDFGSGSRVVSSSIEGQVLTQNTSPMAPIEVVRVDVAKVTSDQDYSDIIASAVSALNKDFVAAKDSGLMIRLEVETLSRFEAGQANVPVIKASVLREFSTVDQERD